MFFKIIYSHHHKIYAVEYTHIVNIVKQIVNILKLLRIINSNKNRHQNIKPNSKRMN